jgi:hypothetical protein
MICYCGCCMCQCNKTVKFRLSVCVIVKHLYKQRMATEAIEGIATEEMSESAIFGGQVWQQLPMIILNLQYPS